MNNSSLNSERYRLRTFNFFPTDCPVQRQELASSGFYYEGWETEVTCFCCGGIISTWEIGEDPKTKHRETFPYCLFVQNNFDNDLFLTQTQHSNDHVNYTSERQRLLSFVNRWPHSFISPEEMAQNGFIFLNAGDRVQCVFCRGILRHWKPGDIPDVEHRYNFPLCPFMMGVEVGNSPIPPSSRSLPSELNQILIPYKKPSIPNLIAKDQRVKSFISWPSCVPMDIDKLSEVGFFYCGIGDWVQCCYCATKLKNWRHNGDLWHEHELSFSNCIYVKLNKPIHSGRTEPRGPLIELDQETERLDCIMESIVVKAFLRTRQYPPYLVRLAVKGIKTDQINVDTLSESVQLRLHEIKAAEALVSLTETITETNNERKCVICLVKDVQILYIPCAHLITCSGCALAFENCPLCRKPVEWLIKSYFA